jgi:hypothetical protein
MSKLTAALMSSATHPAPSEAEQLGSSQAAVGRVPRTRSKPKHLHRASSRRRHRSARDAVSDDGDEGDGDDDPHELVPDPVVCREFNISAMTLWRWDHDAKLAALGLPPPVIIRRRKFRVRQQLEEFKRTMMRRAIAERSQLPARPQAPNASSAKTPSA